MIDKNKHSNEKHNHLFNKCSEHKDDIKDKEFALDPELNYFDGGSEETIIFNLALDNMGIDLSKEYRITRHQIKEIYFFIRRSSNSEFFKERGNTFELFTKYILDEINKICFFSLNERMKAYRIFLIAKVLHNLERHHYNKLNYDEYIHDKCSHRDSYKMSINYIYEKARGIKNGIKHESRNKLIDIHDSVVLIDHAGEKIFSDVGNKICDYAYKNLYNSSYYAMRESKNISDVVDKMCYKFRYYKRNRCLYFLIHDFYALNEIICQKVESLSYRIRFEEYFDVTSCEPNENEYLEYPFYRYAEEDKEKLLLFMSYYSNLLKMYDMMETMPFLN